MDAALLVRWRRECGKDEACGAVEGGVGIEIVWAQ